MLKNWSSTILHKMEDNDPRLRRLGRRDGNTREEMEAGPSVAVEASVVDKPRLGRLEQKHSIFLSHSSAQKAFVRRLRNALERNAYLPFFDEDPDSLPRGEPFVQHLKDAARLADVAIVVLSDDFFNSKWPMIELGMFMEERRRRKSVLECKELSIFPLFVGFSVEEFRDEGRRLGWLKKWHELGGADSRIDVSKWEDAVGVLGGINGIQYKDFRNEEEYIGSIVSAILKLVSPDLKWEDRHVKGKLKFYQAVAEMFAKAPARTRFVNVRTIGLYGMGGMGKTTICKSLCNEYFAEFNGKVWHAELGKKGTEEIQKDVLRHLVGASESLLNQTVKCKDQWQSLLRRKIEHKVFLSIDNVWNEDESRKQAECLLGMGFHPESRVIVTSRNREVLEWLGVQKECCFEMPELDEEDATAVLLQSAAPGHDIESLTEYQRAAVGKVVERCFLAKGPICGTGCEKQYVPLALEVLGRQLRLPLCGSLAKLTKWVNKLDLKRCNQKQHPIFSVLRLGYDNLPSCKHKSIFLDVALCAPRQEDNTSASVQGVCKWLSMVYRVDVDDVVDILEDLQRNGLIERWEDVASPFGMHELYSEFAKAEAGKEEDFDKQQYLYHEDGVDVPAIMQTIPRQKNWPLRRIHAYNGGFSELSSRELRCVVNVEVLKLEFCFELESLDLRCLKSLRSLEIRGCFELRIVEGLKDLEHLKFFRWNTCRVARAALDFPKTLEIVEVYGSKESGGAAFGFHEGCRGLVELTLSRHPLLAAVPDLSMLRKLEKVDFSGCCRIEEVRGLEGLCRLKELNLQNCKRLRHCYGFENLATLETLNLEGCEILQLPEEFMWDLTGLVNLRCMNIGGCAVLRLVLNSPRLNQVGVHGCANLRMVVLSSDSWNCLNRLNEDTPGIAQTWTFQCRNVLHWNSFEHHHTVNFSNCHTIESLGDMGSLRSLRHLYLRNCEMLTTLPDLSNSPLLEVVDLSYCNKLEDLGDIGALRSLRYLYLRSCNMLTTLLDFSSSPLLEVVDLSYCNKLQDLGDIGSLRSLRYLYLRSCHMLTTLPDLSNSPLLEVDLSSCDKLEDLGKQGPLRALQRLDLRECGSLTRLGDLGSPLLDKLDLSYCLSLECLGPIGDLRSLRYLDLRSCKILTNVPDLSNLPSLEVVDLSSCDNLKDFGDVGALRALRHLHLWECGSLTRLGYLGSPHLEELNLSYCRKLESLGDIGPLRSLRYLYLQGCKVLTTLPDLRDSPLLEVVDLSCCDKLEDVGDLGALRALQRLGLRECGSLTGVGDLGSPLLDKLDLSYCRKLERLGELGSLRSLRYLHLKGCEMLTTLPDLSNLRFLEAVDFSGCDKLEDFRGLGPLPALRHPHVLECESLTRLGDLGSSHLDRLGLSYDRKLESSGDIRALRSLRFLDLGSCKMLTTLPDLSNLHLLEVVDFSCCDKLEDLADLGAWRALRLLHLRECGSLTRLGAFRNPDLVKLDLSCCRKLESLGDIRSLTSLTYLYLQSCEMLTTLPDLSNSPLLEKVDLSCCYKLEDVGDLCSLRALQRLYLRGCRSLTRLGDLGSPHLDKLDLSYCRKLESIGDLGSLRALRFLYLQSCEMLTTLPDLSNLPSLELVDLSCCYKLEDLGDIGPLPALRRLDLRDCVSLTSLRDLGCPDLKVLDLSGCSKLEILGGYGWLRSLVELYLSGCKSLISMPDRGHFPLLEVLVMEGCVNLMTCREVSNVCEGSVSHPLAHLPAPHRQVWYRCLCVEASPIFVALVVVVAIGWLYAKPA